MRIPFKKLTEENKFDRRYACWANNHRGFSKYKKANRKKLRRILKSGECDGT